jgi:hypothetical protein
MRAKDGPSLLKAHNEEFKITPISLREHEALPGVVMTPVTLATNAPTPGGQDTENITVLLTFAPTRRWSGASCAISSWAPEKNRPAVETMLPGLRNKYGGPESYRDKGNQTMWIWDAAGQQVMGTAAQGGRHEVRECLAGRRPGRERGGNSPGSSNQYSNSCFDQQLQQGYDIGNGRDVFKAMCQSHTLVDVSNIDTIPRGSAADLLQSVPRPAVAVPRERCRRRRVIKPPRAGK